MSTAPQRYSRLMLQPEYASVVEAFSFCKEDTAAEATATTVEMSAPQEPVCNEGESDRAA